MEKKRVFVFPGEIAVTRQPAVISTLLGSCVAICLHNRSVRGGGMNHFMLPSATVESQMGHGGKYGDISSQKLIQTMLRLDSNPSHLEASVFGGGAVVGHLNSGFEIGVRNVQMAISTLARHRIQVVRKKTGGENGMRIFFDTQSGEITVKLIQKSEMTRQIEAKKRTFAQRQIRVLIVDDSMTVRRVLRSALEADEEVVVVGEAGDAFEARSKIVELDPDVITLDIIMPRLNGVAFLKKLMVHYPKPVVIVSSIAQKGSKMRHRAMDIGAVSVLDKEDLRLYADPENVKRMLVHKVKSAAATPVTQRTEQEVAHI